MKCRAIRICIAEKVGSVTDEADVVTAMGAIQRLIDKKRAAAKSATKKILLFDDDSAGADKILEDMKEEINNLYSSIDELAADLDREKAKLAAIRENKLTTQRIYEILERFKDLYDVMRVSQLVQKHRNTMTNGCAYVFSCLCFVLNDKLSRDTFAFFCKGIKVRFNVIKDIIIHSL